MRSNAFITVGSLLAAVAFAAPTPEPQSAANPFTALGERDGSLWLAAGYAPYWWGYWPPYIPNTCTNDTEPETDPETEIECELDEDLVVIPGFEDSTGSLVGWRFSDDEVVEISEDESISDPDGGHSAKFTLSDPATGDGDLIGYLAQNITVCEGQAYEVSLEIFVDDTTLVVLNRRDCFLVVSLDDAGVAYEDADSLFSRRDGSGFTSFETDSFTVADMTTAQLIITIICSVDAILDPAVGAVFYVDNVAVIPQ